jgi:hypothetical protein
MMVSCRCDQESTVHIGKRHTIGIRADSQTHPRFQFVCVISCHSKLMWCNLLGYTTYRYYACCAQMLTVAVLSSVCKRSLSHTVPSPQDYAWYDKIAGSINVQPHSVRTPQALHFRSIITLWKDIATAWILQCHTKISLFGLSLSGQLHIIILNSKRATRFQLWVYKEALGKFVYCLWNTQKHPRFQFVCVIYYHCKWMWSNLIRYTTWRAITLVPLRT